MKYKEIDKLWLVKASDGYVSLERASCASEAVKNATAKRPGYEGCTAEEYHSEYEKQVQNDRYDNMRERIAEIKQCLTE